MATEKIQNGGFEDFTGTADDSTTDTFDNWTGTVFSGGYIDAVTSPVQSGTYAAQLERTTNVCYLVQEVELTALATETFSYYTYADIAQSGRVRIYYTDGDTYYLQDDLSWSTSTNHLDDLAAGTGSYAQKSLEFTAANYSGTYYISIENISNTNTVYVDNVSLLEEVESGSLAGDFGPKYINQLEGARLKDEGSSSLDSLHDLRRLVYESKTSRTDVSVRDLIRAFLVSETSRTNVSIRDLWRIYLIAQGVDEKMSLEDMLKDWLENTGF